jgi:predicted dienelactone hydrolase
MPRSPNGESKPTPPRGRKSRGGLPRRSPRSFYPFLAIVILALSTPAHATPASAPGIDAPELARLGPFAVGVHSLTLTQPDQPDPLAYDARSQTLARGDRVLPVDIWYPAEIASGAAPVVYDGALAGESGTEVAFTIPGVAVRDARPRPATFPLVILAHGYGGTPVAMSWLAENLASKGYVVVAPHFRDPPITDMSKFAGPLARRPIDIAFVTAAAQARAMAGERYFASADPSRTALIGYSMGGYGVLTAAGALLDPALAGATHGALAPYVRGGARAGELKAAHLKAVVAISPANRFGPIGAWGPDGLGAITTPTLLIVGDHDTTVGYDPGVKTVFNQEIHAPRYLLTFENAGHNIGMDPAPAAMTHDLWDQDWFEDPVWRKERIIGVCLHMITAFLDLEVMNDVSKARYLDVPVVVGADGVWPASVSGSYGAVSAGQPGVTVWKGFQRGHAVGLELRRLEPEAPRR